jgi:hypothetical protein
VNAPFATVIAGSELVYEVQLLRLSRRGPDELTKVWQTHGEDCHCPLYINGCVAACHQYVRNNVACMLFESLSE